MVATEQATNSQRQDVRGHYGDGVLEIQKEFQIFCGLMSK